MNRGKVLIRALLIVSAVALYAGLPDSTGAAQENAGNDKRKAPLTLDQIKRMVKVPAPDSAIAIELRSRGIDFPPSIEIIDQLKIEGAGGETLGIIREWISNRAPSVTLKLSDSEVLLGESVALFAITNDSDRDPLEYVWSQSDGTIQGEGASVILSTSSIKASCSPFDVLVKVTVTDRKGAGISDTKVVRIRIPQVETRQGLSMKTQYEAKEVSFEVRWEVVKAEELSGSVEVELSSSPYTQSVTGRFPSRPSSFYFDKQENVADIYIKELPGQNNNWKAVRVIIHPQKPGSLVRFAIIWQAIKSKQEKVKEN